MSLSHKQRLSDWQSHRLLADAKQSYAEMVNQERMRALRKRQQVDKNVGADPSSSNTGTQTEGRVRSEAAQTEACHVDSRPHHPLSSISYWESKIQQARHQQELEDYQSRWKMRSRQLEDDIWLEMERTRDTINARRENECQRQADAQRKSEAERLRRHYEKKYRRKEKSDRERFVMQWQRELSEREVDVVQREQAKHALLEQQQAQQMQITSLQCTIQKELDELKRDREQLEAERSGSRATKRVESRERRRPVGAVVGGDGPRAP
jgi:hypothetical protein|mmetsp:Transcript_54942/g.90563  ORF Transcript_54942/g.90563 Transcript_54942/m.90563 type:complete len:266 (+) Transcript_54942:132-929(+)